MQIKYHYIFFISILLTPSIYGQKLERIYDYDTKKWGVRDEQWNVVIPTIYDEIEPKLGAIFAGKKDGKMLLFNGDGSIRVPLIYQHIQAHFNGFRDHFGFAGVTKNDKVPNSWGMIYSDGTLVLPEKYQYVRALSADLLVAKI